MTLKEAIERSASQNEIVRVTVTTLTGGARAVEDLAVVEGDTECDDPKSDLRMIDIWGRTFDGREFRLHLLPDTTIQY
jgi:hypothetical protein